jgi:predicted outer membrane repeat protein
LVTITADSGAGSLRQAMTDAPASSATIQVNLPPGSVIALASSLPQMSKTLTIEGNGVTLTRGSGFVVSDDSYMMNNAGILKVIGIHFKGGKVTSSSKGGAALRNGLSTLTVESCIFSGNQATSMGGAIYSQGDLNVSGCTFYGNSVGSQGGAIYITGSGKKLTLTGNLFYGNTAANPNSRPVMYNASSAVITSNGYNVSDMAITTHSETGSGWTEATGDLGNVTTLPVAPLTFRLLSGSGAAAKLPAPLPSGYPAKDFYGNPISGGGAAGAVQSAASASGYGLRLLVNYQDRGSISASSTADADGLYTGSATITATPVAPHVFDSWLIDGVKAESTANPLELTLSGHTTVQAVFTQVITVTVYTDATTAPAGSLRAALEQATDGARVLLGAANKTILLKGRLQTTCSITLEGKGLILTPDTSWTPDSGLLYVGGGQTVKISGVHFKGGKAGNTASAIYIVAVAGRTVTLESCIFSGNACTGTGATVYSESNQTVSGCTFYNNTVSSNFYAEAINMSSGNNLTITGNLFYGNSGRVVVGTGTIDSKGYNVTNHTYGSANGNTGDWAKGTNDKTFSDLSITGVPFYVTADANFLKPLSANLSALQIVPTDTDGFPTTQFDGTERTAAGGNTAAGAWSTGQ